MQLVIISIIVLVFLVLGTTFVVTWRTQHDPLEKQFLHGHIPSPFPDGFYQGTVGGQHLSTWQGKKFNRAAQTGINIFVQHERNIEIYPFKTYVGNGAVDRRIQVLKIDYNISQNPFWLRLILDEVVETSPNHYLGKVHVRILPGVFIPLGYFSLDR